MIDLNMLIQNIHILIPLKYILRVLEVTNKKKNLIIL